MPALPGTLLAPLRAQFAALPSHNLPSDPGQPLGCDRRRFKGRKTLLWTDVTGTLLHVTAAGASQPDAALLREKRDGPGTLGPLPPRLLVHWDRGLAGLRVQAVLADHDDTERGALILPTRNT